MRRKWAEAKVDSFHLWPQADSTESQQTQVPHKASTSTLGPGSEPLGAVVQPEWGGYSRQAASLSFSLELVGIA